MLHGGSCGLYLDGGSAMWFKSNFTIPAVAAICFCLIGGTSPAAADILHVPGDFTTIQEAIDAAMDGDEVEVHPGTYNENINFLGKAIRVYSTDGPDVTIIDAQQSGSVVICASSEGADTVLDGFTITGADTPVGGGMYNDGSSPTVTNCTFSGNRGGGYWSPGAGMYNLNSSPTVTNCTFSGNSSGGHHGSGPGGGMRNDSSSPTVTNCTFSGNSGGGMYNYNENSNPTVTNSILWGNTPGEIADVGGAVTTVTYSDVQGGFPGTGNIDADPLFVDADGPDDIPGTDDDDLRLQPGSPCIDAADNTAPGLVGITEDLDGNPRFVEDPDTTDTGNGDPPIVDMGAYEFQVVSRCPADFDNSGDVGVKDLLVLLGAWGPCPPKGDCPADFDASGDVGVKDLLVLLGNWGPCP